MNHCRKCGKKTDNPKYCSRSCAVSANNKKNKKRKLSKQCLSCNKKIHSNISYCKPCWKVKNGEVDRMLKEVIYQKGNRASAYSIVRGRARTIAKNNNMNSCQKCGYSKHVEIAHVKAISEFKDTAMLSEINALSNLMALCRNCHWEMDHNL